MGEGKFIIKSAKCDLFVVERAGSMTRWDSKREDAMQFTAEQLRELSDAARPFLEILPAP